MKAKYGFSMIELIMVVVVTGILASLAIPRMDRDLRQEAIDSIMSDIMLTQQMALSDHRHGSNPKWQRSYWRWRYTRCSAIGNKVYYSVFSDRDMEGNADAGEAAIDSYNKQYLDAPRYCSSSEVNTNYSERVLLTDKFGIDKIIKSGGCSAQHIAFDELGRPHSGITNLDVPTFSSLMKRDCDLTFKLDHGFLDNNDTFTIRIEAITGRVFLAN